MKYKRLITLQNQWKWKMMNYTDALMIDAGFSGEFKWTMHRWGWCSGEFAIVNQG
jgi:hypothetical protein